MYSPNEMQVHQLIADEIEINWDAVKNYIAFFRAFSLWET